MRTLLTWLLLSLTLVSLAQTPATKRVIANHEAVGINLKTVLDNDVVRVVRVTCEAYCSEPRRFHPLNYMNVFLSDMELEFTRDGHTYTTNPAAGEVRFLYQGSVGAIRNPTNQRLEWLAITLKKPPRGLRPGVVPAGTPFPGMAMRRLLDNDAVRASHLVLDAGMRERPHSHPTDLLVITITGGEVETTVGNKTERRSMKPGEVMWFPHDVEHHAANIGSASIESVSVHIK